MGSQVADDNFCGFASTEGLPGGLVIQVAARCAILHTHFCYLCKYGLQRDAVISGSAEDFGMLERLRGEVDAKKEREGEWE